MTVRPYAPPTFREGIELQLSRNEGRPPADFATPEFASEDLARYPSLSQLQEALCRRIGVDRDRLLVTAGADDGLLRAALATMRPGRSALATTPTFQMIPRYVALAGGATSTVPWLSGDFPTEAFLEAATPDTGLAFVVSPNNPTGAVAAWTDVERIARALPDALVVLDAAYAEFADEDLTERALTLPNVVILRTLSKAWGLAGLRIGYAIGSPAQIERLARSGNPFPVSAPAAALAVQRLTTGTADVADYVERTRSEREALTRTLRELGAAPVEGSQGNFVLATDVRADWARRAAASLGVALRAFPDEPALARALRVTLPGDAADFARLSTVLTTALAPRALLFDMDGVLADVSRSYRAAIVGTAKLYGVALTGADVERAKAAGNANDDWELTWRLVRERGPEVTLEEVTARFEALYQPGPDGPGLQAQERLLVPRERLAAWGERYRLGIVTGRPRRDAERFLEQFGIADLFEVVVCREDAPAKPEPDAVQLALARLGEERAWMVGDTRDDLDAARAAGVVPIGVTPPGAPGSSGTAGRDWASHLEEAGAARVLERTTDLEELL